MTELVRARWKCAYPVEVAGQGTIAPGGLAQIPAAEATASGNWEPVTDDLTELPATQLRELAAGEGIDGVASMTKPEIAKALTTRTKENA